MNKEVESVALKIILYHVTHFAGTLRNLRNVGNSNIVFLLVESFTVIIL